MEKRLKSPLQFLVMVTFVYLAVVLGNGKGWCHVPLFFFFPSPSHFLIEMGY